MEEGRKRADRMQRHGRLQEEVRQTKTKTWPLWFTSEKPEKAQTHSGLVKESRKK